MKKNIIMILSAVLAAAFIFWLIIFGYNKYMNTYYSPGKGLFANRNVLIAYYDRKGETEVIAKEIKNQIKNADIEKLEPEKAYPKNENEYNKRIKAEKHSSEYVKLKKRPITQKYDIIFIGTPVELFTISPVVVSFMKQNDFDGKIVIPFIVYFDDRGGGAVASKFRKRLPNSHVKNSFMTKNGNIKNLDIRIMNWLSTIRVTRTQIRK